MSGSDAVWPDGARGAVDKAFRSWWDNPWNYQVCATDLFTALEPFVQQRIEAATQRMRQLINDAHDDGYSDGLRDGSAADINVLRDAMNEIDEQVPPAIGIYQTIPDRVRLVIDQRDDAESIVADLRAEVARLTESNAAWVKFADAIGKIVNCLYSVVPDGNGHILKSVARLREDGERLRVAAVDAINAVSDPAMGHLFRAVDAYDVARSAPGGEG